MQNCILHLHTQTQIKKRRTSYKNRGVFFWALSNKEDIIDLHLKIFEYFLLDCTVQTLRKFRTCKKSCLITNKAVEITQNF